MESELGRRITGQSFSRDTQSECDCSSADHEPFNPSGRRVGIDKSRSEISWIVSIQTFLTFGLACFTGALFDKYGHRPLIATGTFCLVLGFCMLSLCSKYYQLMLVHASLLPVGCNLM